MAAESLPLSAVHQRTVAIKLTILGQEQVLHGKGFYEVDPELGNVLRIELKGEPGSEIVLVESTWQGEVLTGKSVGAEFLIRVR
jgi:hypothetical protein